MKSKTGNRATEDTEITEKVKGLNVFPSVSSVTSVAKEVY
jgi:hypothetical protein